MEHHILLIDDDIDEFLLLNDALQDFTSVNCSYAGSAEAGLAMMENKKPDFVMLDMNMPIKNGLECLIMIKNNPALAQVPVMIFSTCVTDKLSREALLQGAIACVKKPHSITALKQVLMRAFETAGISGPSSTPGSNI